MLPVTLLSLSVHEMCHGLAAYKMGDNTAKMMGRLSLDPLKHLDPIGFFCMLFFGFGWAKPVPVNPRNFDDYKKGIRFCQHCRSAFEFLFDVFGDTALPYLRSDIYASVGRIQHY